MKTLYKAIAIASLATVATAAQAEVSVTGGVMSDYVFRGINTSTGSGYAAVDYEQDGFYVGVWGADIGDSLEVDLYLGYGIELDNGLSLGAGYTRYEYTGSKLTQDEFAIDVGIAGFGLSYVMGSADGEISDIVGLVAFGALSDADSTLLGDEIADVVGTNDTDADYSVITLSYEAENWGFLVGSLDVDEVAGQNIGDSSYNWAELSTSADVAGLTVGASLGVQFGSEVGGVDVPSNDGYITFDISKQFDL